MFLQVDPVEFLMQYFVKKMEDLQRQQILSTGSIDGEWIWENSWFTKKIALSLAKTE